MTISLCLSGTSVIKFGYSPVTVSIFFLNAISQGKKKPTYSYSLRGLIICNTKDLLQKLEMLNFLGKREGEKEQKPF